MRRGRSPSKATATNGGPPSTIWHWANGGPSRRAHISCRSGFPRNASERSATARNSPLTPATMKTRTRRTAARISSSPQNRIATMKKTIVAAALTLAAAVPATPARAADKETRQMMADIRMLQEQAQQLQNLLASVGEALKAVNARMDARFDDQTNASRKAFADQK